MTLERFIHSDVDEVKQWLDSEMPAEEIICRLRTKLNDALIKKSLGYDVEEVKTQIRNDQSSTVKMIEKRTKHFPPDVRAIEKLMEILDQYENEKGQLSLFGR